MNRGKLTLLLAIMTVVIGQSCQNDIMAEDGHSLWFNSLGDQGLQLSVEKTTSDIAKNEIENNWKGKQKIDLVVLEKSDDSLGKEGFRIGFQKKSVKIEANTEIGVLYGVYHLIRLQETQSLPQPNDVITEVPAFEYRVLNHWDNPNGTVERGFAGKSLWKWESLPGTVLPVYEEYARANASIGINSTVLNNVNADPKMLSTEYLQKIKVLSDIFRPYGIKVFLSLNFAAPKHLGGLKTSDPLDPEVIKWWNDKTAEIYSIIPDFGGFLVKANSEGQSGPQDYGRTHVDGANMIAEALKPFGGNVMWRAFVYQPNEKDRAKQAYSEFMPFDGQFMDNGIIQIKNGPVDFQPREPFSPLLGAMKKTPTMLEFQITQEYLGHSHQLAYLSTMWEECLNSDTYQQGAGSTVASCTDGSLYKHQLTAISGVANTG